MKNKNDSSGEIQKTSLEDRDDVSLDCTTRKGIGREVRVSAAAVALRAQQPRCAAERRMRSRLSRGFWRTEDRCDESHQGSSPASDSRSQGPR